MTPHECELLSLKLKELINSLQEYKKYSFGQYSAGLSFTINMLKEEVIHLNEKREEILLERRLKLIKDGLM